MKEFIKGKYLKEEIRDFEYFKTFQERLGKEDIFYPMNYGSDYDLRLVEAKTRKEKIVELKCRNKSALIYDDCFIEFGKWNKLMKEWRRNGTLPIYINFFDNPDDVYVWILPEVDEPNVHIGVRIYGDEEDRLGLLWNNGYHYQWNGEKYIITKPTHKKRITRPNSVFNGDWDALEELAKFNTQSLYDNTIIPL